MDKLQKRRSFLKSVALGGAGIAVSPNILKAGNAADNSDAKNNTQQNIHSTGRKYNAPYTVNILIVLHFRLVV